MTCSQEGREAVSRVGGHGAARWRRGGGGLRGHRLGQLWVFNDHPLVALDLGLQLRAKGQLESPHTVPLPGPPAHDPISLPRARAGEMLHMAKAHCAHALSSDPDLPPVKPTVGGPWGEEPAASLTRNTKHSPVPKKPTLPPNLFLSLQSVDR